MINTTDLQVDLMNEGMTAIRNIAGALPAWDLKPDVDRLAAIFAVSDALYVLDTRSEVTMDLVRETLEKLRVDHPELALMLPKTFAWADLPTDQ